MGLVVTATTIDVMGDRLVVAKRRVPASAGRSGWSSEEALATAAQHTETEDRWLAAAQHHGVVRLRRVSRTEAALATDFAASSTLRTANVTSKHLAVALASVAYTLADLHRGGVMHGHLSMDHILLTGAHLDQAVLCSPALEQRGGPEADVAALASIAEHARREGPATKLVGRREDRRWRAAIAELRRGGGRLGAAAAAEVFAGLGG